MRIAFDIDDTLIIPSVARGFGDNTPNYEVIAIYRFFQAQGAEMILWSGSGVDWAKRWGEKLGLEPFTVRIKEASDDVDIAFDDCDVKLATVNVRVKRMNNGISRKDWNENKNRSFTPVSESGSVSAGAIAATKAVMESVSEKEPCCAEFPCHH